MSSRDANSTRANGPKSPVAGAASDDIGHSEHTSPVTETAGLADNFIGVENYELENLWYFARVPTDIANIASGLREPQGNRPQESRPEETVRLLSDTLQDGSVVSGTELMSLRYASRKIISKFIPDCDPNNKRARTCRVVMSRRKVMLSIQTTLAFVVFLANIALTAWATKSHPTSSVIGSLSIGRCSRIRNVNIGIHLLLNVLSSLFLGAGNYCMQILVAPTGAEVRSAHESGTYFDIGIHSIHNIRHITWHRKLFWFGLGICSTLLHLM